MQATREGIIRGDGRKPSDLRTLQITNSHLTTADGSCRFGLGKTIVDISVFGPIEDSVHVDHSRVNQATLVVEVFSVHTTRAQNEVTLEKYIEDVFKGIIVMGKQPQTAIHVAVQVISDDGSLLSCVLNGVMVALMDAGIECKTMMTAVTIGLTNNIEHRLDFLDRDRTAMRMGDDHMETDDHCEDVEMKKEDPSDEPMAQLKDQVRSVVVFDPTNKELELLSSLATIAFATKIGDRNELELEYCQTHGRMPFKSLQTLLEHSKTACFKLQYRIKSHFVQSYQAAPTIWVSSRQTLPSSESA